MADPAKEIRVNVRVAEELKAKVMKIQEITGLDESTLVRKSLEAIAEYFEEHSELTVPFVLLPKSAAVARTKKRPEKPAALPARKSGRTDAPVALMPNPSTGSTRISLNEEAAEPAPKKSGPQAKPTRGAMRAFAEKEKGQKR